MRRQVKRQAVAALVASLFALPALAQIDVPGKSRADVRGELLEAQRTGEIRDAGDAAVGLKLNEIWPEHYAAVKRGPGETRAEVQVEVAEAQRTGTLESPAGAIGY